MKKTSEKDIEAALVAAVKKRGGTAEKFTSPGRRSVPDRLITLPNRPMFLIEVKRQDEYPTLAQHRDHNRRRDLGQLVFYVNDLGKIEAILDSAENWLAWSACG